MIRPGLDVTSKGRLEWADDRGAGQCRGDAEPARSGLSGPDRSLGFHREIDDPGRPAWPFVARRQAARTRDWPSDFACHDPGGTRALRSRTGRRERLDQGRLAWTQVRRRLSPITQNGGYYLTAADAEGLVVRPAATTDDATPNAQRHNAAQKSAAPCRPHRRRPVARARRPTDRRSAVGITADNLMAHAALLNALDLRLNAAEIVVTGPDHGRASRRPYAAAALLSAGSCCARRRPDALPAGHPAQAKIAAGRSASAAFVCVGETCSLPVTNPDKIAERRRRDAQPRFKLNLELPALPQYRQMPCLRREVGGWPRVSDIGAEMRQARPDGAFGRRHFTRPLCGHSLAGRDETARV